MFDFVDPSTDQKNSRIYWRHFALNRDITVVFNS